MCIVHILTKRPQKSRNREPYYSVSPVPDKQEELVCPLLEVDSSALTLFSPSFRKEAENKVKRLLRTATGPIQVRHS